MDDTPIELVNISNLYAADGAFAELIDLPTAKSMTTGPAGAFWLDVHYDGNQLNTYFKHPGSDGQWYAVVGNVVNEINSMGGGG